MTIKLTNRARKDIRRLSPETRERVRRAILALLQDPQSGIPLTGPWQGYRRIRVGHHRIVFRVYGDELIIHYVRPRHEAYRRT